MRMTKQIVNGKIYDTDQATSIAQYSNGGSMRDFYHVEETLYKTDNGSYFLHGKGGANTQYSTSHVNGMSSGEEIKPVDVDDALDWAERRDVDTESIISEFEDDLEQA